MSVPPWDPGTLQEAPNVGVVSSEVFADLRE